MAGNSESAKRGAMTTKERYGKDFFTKMGKIGGSKGDGSKKGFAVNRELAVEAGKKSKRKPVFVPSLESMDLEYEDLT